MTSGNYFKRCAIAGDLCDIKVSIIIPSLTFFPKVDVCLYEIINRTV